MTRRRVDFRLCVVTGRRLVPPGRSLADTVAAALRGGADAVQLREKDLAPDALLPLARELRAVTEQFGAALIVNGDPALARDCGAEGVHLPAGSLSVADARKIAGLGLLVGVSVRDGGALRAALAEGADYVQTRAVFPTRSKDRPVSPLGLPALAEWCAAAGPTPVFAVGGVTPELAADVTRAGARISAMGCFMSAEDPASVARALRAAGRSRHLSGLYVLTSEDPERGRTHLDVARAACEGGASVVQYRDKSAASARDRRRLIETAAAIRDECAAAGVTFIVNDRVDVALAVGADGVHLGQDELHLAREWSAGGGRLLGVTAWTPGLARTALQAGADYVGAGPVLPTESKALARAPIGLAGIAAIRGALGPEARVAAIGGIGIGDAAQTVAAGAEMVCVMGAVGRAADPQAAVRAIADELNRNRRGEPIELLR